MAIKDNFPIENETFNHYRITEEVKKIKKAIHTLIKYKFQVIDLENQIIDESNINDIELRKSFTYNRTPKNKRVYLIKP